jgi:hypothetical protein
MTTEIVATPAPTLPAAEWLAQIEQADRAGEFRSTDGGSAIPG